MRTLKGIGGFTLLELLITMAISIVLAFMLAPAFNHLISKNHVKSMASGIQIAMMQARSQAATLGTNVTLAPTANNDWTTGWTISYVDSTGTQQTLTNGEADSKVVFDTSSPVKVVYMRSGRIQKIDANYKARFTITANGDSTVRCVMADLSGRPYTTEAACPTTN
jgi:type IV fimbrial biogenesis protein FimT